LFLSPSLVSNPPAPLEDIAPDALVTRAPQMITGFPIDPDMTAAEDISEVPETLEPLAISAPFTDDTHPLTAVAVLPTLADESSVSEDATNRRRRRRSSATLIESPLDTNEEG
ncbi:hypothetical protein DO97_13235, partial [Neosynechococcus sphagnicola sy1]